MELPCRNMQVSKLSKRKYNVFCLRKLNVDNNSKLYFIKCVNLCSIKLVWRVKQEIEGPANTFDKRCLSTLCKIVNYQTHPLHNDVIILPHGHLNMPYCKTARFQNTVIPSGKQIVYSKPPNG